MTEPTFPLPIDDGQPQPRWITQIACAGAPNNYANFSGIIVALCDDGSLWLTDDKSRTWTRIDETIPKGD